MTFLETILADLELLNIPLEEHYNPDGTHLFKLYLRDSHNPFMVYSPDNPDHILVTLTVDYPLPILEKITNDNRNILDNELKKLGSRLFVHYKVGLLHDSLYFSSGIMLIFDDYSAESMKNSILKLMESYDMIIDATNDMIHNL